MRLSTKIAIDRWLGALALQVFIVLFALRRRRPTRPQPKRIVLIKLLGLGSIIQATPLIAALAERYPQCPISMVTKRGNEKLTERIPIIATSLRIDDTNLIRLAITLWQVVRKLRAEPDPCIINLEAYSNLGALIAAASGARWKAGYFRNPADLKLSSIFDVLVYFNPAAPISEVYMQLGRALDTRAVTPPLARLRALTGDSDEVDTALASCGINARESAFIVINPNASELRLERRWPDENFATTIEHLAQAYPSLRIVIIGVEDERRYVERIISQVAAPERLRVVNFAGRLSLGGLVELLGRARLLVTNDSGPMHIGYSLSIPVLALFGPVAPDHYALHGQEGKHVEIYRRTYCSPCVHHFDVAPCRGDNVCLKSISPTEVTAMAISLLEGQEPTSRANSDIIYSAGGKTVGVVRPSRSDPPCRHAFARPIVSRADLTVIYCPSCRTGFADPSPSDATLAAIYGTHYYDSWDLRDGGKATAAMKRATFRRRLAMCAPWLKPGARVLDLGCATGYFLQEAVSAGYEPFGVDIVPDAIAQCETTFGTGRFFCGEFQDAQFAANPVGTFDAIFMSDYIEHVRQPAAVLELVFRRLAPGGIVVITTPDVSSLSRRIMGARWPHFKVEHLWYFSRQSLQHLLTDVGLQLMMHSAATKSLTLSYLAAQFRAYPHPRLTPLLNGLVGLVPASLADARFRLLTGEVTVVAKRPEP